MFNVFIFYWAAPRNLLASTAYYFLYISCFWDKVVYFMVVFYKTKPNILRIIDFKFLGRGCGVPFFSKKGTPAKHLQKNYNKTCLLFYDRTFGYIRFSGVNVFETLVYRYFSAADGKLSVRVYGFVARGQGDCTALYKYFAVRM